MKKLKPLKLIALFCMLLAINTFGQFEQKLTINGSGAYIYPDFGEEFSSFSLGLGFDGGLQFNMNRHFSLYGSTRFYYLFGGSDFSETYLDNIAFGGGAKFNLLPNFVINPYLFAEINVNLLWYEEYDYITELLDEGNGVAFGALGGGGLDFIINENLAIFVQSGWYYTYWDDRINMYSQLGARINLIKSKTL